MIKVIWSSNGELDDLLQMPADQKRLELTNWYDKEMVDQLADDELDKIIGDNADIFYNEAMEDFEYNIVPMISNQFLGGFVLDENFNVVDPGVLLNDARETCEIYEDDNGDLYWKEEARKAFPLLGFDEDQDKFIDQLDQLDILSTMHNLYPDQDDEDIEIYDIADLIPFDWTLLGNVLNHAVNNLNVVEELTEAKAKNPNKLSNELAEVVDLADEYGYEYFTQMPFTSYDDDPIAIETQYPELFRVIKSFFKEMELLDDATKEDYINDRYPRGDAPITKDDVTLDNPDVLDYLWDLEDQLSTTSPSDFKHDWDVIIRSCEKLANGKGVQFEKEYKTGYNSALDDDEILANREKEESLKEDFIEVTTYDQARDLGSDTKWIWSGNYPGHEDEGEYYFNKYKNLGKMFIDPEKKLCKIVTANKTFIYDKDDKVLKESLNEAVEIHMEGTYDMADLLDAYDEKTGKVHDNLEFIKDLGKNKHLYKDDEGIEFIVTDEGVYDDLDESAVTDKGRHIARQGAGWIHNELYRLSDAVDQLNKRKSLHPGEKEAAKANIDVANDIHRDLIDESLNEDVRFYVDGGDVVDSLKDDKAIGTLYDDGTVELFDAKSVSKADRERIKKDLSNHYYVSFLDEDWINPELYKPFGHDSYDSGYVYEPRDPEEDEARILPPDADDEDWEDDLDEDVSEYQDVYMLVDADGNELYGLETLEDAKEELKGNPEAVKIVHKRMDDSFRIEDPDWKDEVVLDTLHEDTVTWPWGDPNEELPQKKLPDKTSSDSLVNKLI